MGLNVRLKKPIAFMMALFTFALLLVGCSSKENTFEHLDVQVTLHEDGSASIVETWELDLVEGTELYKIMNTEPHQEVSDYVVLRNNEPMTYIEGQWNIDASFDQKAGKFGMRRADGNQEYNWGITDYGENKYTISYKVDNLVMQTASDQMVFWEFVNDSIAPSPESVSLTMSSDVEQFSDHIHGIWAFGYYGDVYFEDGNIRMETTDAFDEYSHLTLLTHIPSNTYTTENIDTQRDFDSYVEQAFEGSDYSLNDYHEAQGKTTVNEPSLIEKFAPTVEKVFGFIPYAIFGVLGFGLINGTKNSKAHKKYYPSFWDKKKELDGQYVRKKPLKNMFYTYAVLEDMEFGGTELKKNDEREYEVEPVLGNLRANMMGNMFTAMLLTFVKEGFIRAEEETVKRIISDRQVTVLYLESIRKPKMFSEVYAFMLSASEPADRGRGNRLTQTDLAKYVSKHDKRFKKIMEKELEKSKEYLDRAEFRYNDPTRLQTDDEEFMEVNKRAKYAYTPKGMELQNRIVKYYNYLLDFTLLDERPVNDVRLWDDIMVSAAMFGITEKVSEELNKMFPRYEQQSAYRDASIHTYNRIGRSVSDSYVSKQKSRSSGSGGSSSRGGGGGSGGGGSGGGVR